MDKTSGEKGRCPFSPKELSLRTARPAGHETRRDTLSPRKEFFATYTPLQKTD
jgi:hypothetical protein